MNLTLYDQWIEVFGEYEPILTTDGNGVSITTPDFAYIGMVAFSLILLWQVLGILKGVITSVYTRMYR